MRYLFPVPIAVALVAASPAAAASSASWGKASDVGRDGLVIAAFAVPAVHGDLEGMGYAALSQAGTGFVTKQLKGWTNETRPDGSDDKSFPSGHTSASFAAAASLHKRYGWKYGIPAYAVAGFVGAARVKADRHYVHDVLAGAALGTAGGWFLSRRRNDRVQWLPWAGTRGAGAEVSVRF